jgi:hypothetical protein
MRVLEKTQAASPRHQRLLSLAHFTSKSPNLGNIRSNYAGPALNSKCPPGLTTSLVDNAFAGSLSLSLTLTSSLHRDPSRRRIRRQRTSLQTQPQSPGSYQINLFFQPSSPAQISNSRMRRQQRSYVEKRNCCGCGPCPIALSEWESSKRYIQFGVLIRFIHCVSD